MSLLVLLISLAGVVFANEGRQTAQGLAENMAKMQGQQQLFNMASAGQMPFWAVESALDNGNLLKGLAYQQMMGGSQQNLAPLLMAGADQPSDLLPFMAAQQGTTPAGTTNAAAMMPFLSKPHGYADNMAQMAGMGAMAQIAQGLQAQGKLTPGMMAVGMEMMENGDMIKNLGYMNMFKQQQAQAQQPASSAMFFEGAFGGNPGGASPASAGGIRGGFLPEELLKGAGMQAMGQQYSSNPYMMSQMMDNGDLVKTMGVQQLAKQYPQYAQFAPLLMADGMEFMPGMMQGAGSQSQTGASQTGLRGGILPEELLAVSGMQAMAQQGASNPAMLAMMGDGDFAKAMGVQSLAKQFPKYSGLAPLALADMEYGPAAMMAGMAKAGSSASSVTGGARGGFIPEELLQGAGMQAMQQQYGSNPYMMSQMIDNGDMIKNLGVQSLAKQYPQYANLAPLAMDMEMYPGMMGQGSQPGASAATTPTIGRRLLEIADAEE